MVDPHVDAPSHMGFGDGIDSYKIEQYSGPVKVIDVRHFRNGRTVTINAFKGRGIQPGDIVLIYTGYNPPVSDDELPENITLTPEAAEYLAELPVRAFGTDAWSVINLSDQSPVHAQTPAARAVPTHHSFLSRGIPIYESLFNIDKLLDKKTLYFTGVPLNIKDGDGMMVRPVVFVY